jgi:hypothetical protein
MWPCMRSELWALVALVLLVLLVLALTGRL